GAQPQPQGQQGASHPAQGERGAQTQQAQPAEGGQGGGRGGKQDTGDFTTVQVYDKPVPPQLNAQDEFFEFLFSASELKYADLKGKAEKQEPLPSFALKDVKLTINVDADYAVV